MHVVKGRISVIDTNAANRRDKKLTFRNNALFMPCASKINYTIKDNAEHLDIVMPVCKMLRYSDNYSMTSRSLWNHYRDKLSDAANENDNANFRVHNNKTKQVNILSIRQK